MFPICSPSHGIVAISFLGLSLLVVAPAQAKPAGGADPPPAGSHQSSKPGKSGTAHNPVPPPGNPDPKPMPRGQAPPLEERLQRGEMEEAVAQGQVSDRLEQFHKTSPGGTP
ncbi:MAG TPA: hypothetical protein VKB33_03020 [Nitrospira sp.]|nr:hypothetical protein [Nitrospira sp.]